MELWNILKYWTSSGRVATSSSEIKLLVEY